MADRMQHTYYLYPKALISYLHSMYCVYHIFIDKNITAESLCKIITLQIIEASRALNQCTNTKTRKPNPPLYTLKLEIGKRVKNSYYEYSINLECTMSTINMYYGSLMVALKITKADTDAKCANST